jgi:hypothetical protein
MEYSIYRFYVIYDDNLKGTFGSTDFMSGLLTPAYLTYNQNKTRSKFAATEDAKYTLRSKVIFAQGGMSNINSCNGVLNLSFLRHL